MKAVTHNIKHTLKFGGTLNSVNRALSFKPQIVSFQEFDPNDEKALSIYSVVVDPNDLTFKKKSPHPYLLCRAGAAGLPVLLKRKYVKSIDNLTRINLAPHTTGVRPTYGTEVSFTNRYGVELVVLNTHPMAHHDVPANKAAFNEAIDNIEKWAERVKKSGKIPLLMMDGNGADKIKGLISCWDGHNKLPTGPGGNTIDGCWTTKSSLSVDTFTSPSDHNGVVTRYRFK